MMEVRLAKKKELARIQGIFRSIIEQMERDGLMIWDEIYPCEFFEDDIEKGQLYLLVEGEEIAAAFALCAANDGGSAVEWEDAGAKAYYLDRLGVNVGFRRQGVGRQAVQQAMGLARGKGAGYLRLFAVDVNEPAIRLYENCGFRRAGGIYEQEIDDIVLREYGFERKL